MKKQLKDKRVVDVETTHGRYAKMLKNKSFLTRKEKLTPQLPPRKALGEGKNKQNNQKQKF